MLPRLLNLRKRNLPKRDELRLRMVFALPKYSSSCDAATICLLMLTSDPLSSDRHCSMCLADSVLPAPDSPDTITDWSTMVSRMLR